MKREEKVASDFLMRRFGKKPTYEPLGDSSAPDFSIDGTAFEVRRLNERFFREDGTDEGLEELEIRLIRAVRKRLAKIAFSNQGGTVFWGLRFKRPLSGEVRSIVKHLAATARNYYLARSRKRTEFSEGGVTLVLFGAGDPHVEAFLPGYESDDDSGGMLGEIYPRFIRLALEGKIRKTKEIIGKFDRWVLVLPDHIMYGAVAADDMGQLDLNLGHFNSVVVINPTTGSLILEYPYGSLKLHEEIRQRAYELYEKRGREHGHDLDDWLKAEAEPAS